MSNAFGYALVAALGNVVGALAVTRRAARELALIEHFVAFGAGFMLAVALVEVLPEAFARSGTAAPALVLAGYLAVKGDDLLAAGVRPGPQVGETLERLLAEVLEDPSRNTRDYLLSRV